ncbi:MAG: hypothetical protein J5722_06425 [Oscillospiraceae bacterium]|nr:hypothetical protein [Oscillospiraceae bacterium]
MGSGFRFSSGEGRPGGCIFVFFALVFMGMGLFAAISSIRERIAYNNSNEYKTVTADLVSAEKRKDSDNKVYYYCTWEYKIDNESFYYNTSPTYKPASTLQLTLYRDAEGRYQVMDKDNVSVIVIGFIFFAIGAALLLWSVVIPQRRTRAQD